MIAHLQQYFGLYNLEYSTSHEQLAKSIEISPNKKIQTRHPRGYIFFYFQELVKGNISLEEFFQIGDISNTKYSLTDYPGYHAAAVTAGEKMYRSLLAEPTNYQDAIVVREETLYQYFRYHNPDAEPQLQNICEQYHIVLTHCS